MGHQSRISAIAAVLAAGLFIACPPAALADDRAEVAAALFAASATQAAVERSADATIVKERSEITALAVEVRGGKAAVVRLVAEEDGLVARLASQDREYAVQVAIFRDTLTDITKTPQGVDALAAYNRGDVAAGLAAFDKITAADDRMRQVKVDLESAAERRPAALLAYDAWARGHLDANSVIARFEEVTRLDGSLAWPWADLCGLYVEVGRLTDADAAASKAAAVATTVEDRAAIEEMRGIIQEREGNRNGALATLKALVADRRAALLLRPDDTLSRLALARVLSSLAGIQQELGDPKSASSDRDEAFKLVATTTPAPNLTYAWYEALADAQAMRASDEIRLGEFDKARGLETASLAIVLNVAAARGDGSGDQGKVGARLLAMAAIDLSAGDLAAAQAAFTQGVSTNESIVARDSSFQAPRRAIAVAKLGLGSISLADGDYTQAARYFEDSLGTFKQLAQTDSVNHVDRVLVVASLVDLGITPGSAHSLEEVVTYIESGKARFPPTAQELAYYYKIKQLIAAGAERGDRETLFPSLSVWLGDRAAQSSDSQALLNYRLAKVSATRLLAKQPASVELRTALAAADAAFAQAQRHEAGQTDVAPVTHSAALDVTPPLAAALQQPGLKGAVVVDLGEGLEGSNQLRVGDIIETFNGQPVDTKSLYQALAALSRGAKWTLVLFRPGQPATITLTSGPNAP